MERVCRLVGEALGVLKMKDINDHKKLHFLSNGFLKSVELLGTPFSLIKEVEKRGDLLGAITEAERVYRDLLKGGINPSQLLTFSPALSSIEQIVKELVDKESGFDDEDKTMADQRCLLDQRFWLRRVLHVIYSKLDPYKIGCRSLYKFENLSADTLLSSGVYWLNRSKSERSDGGLVPSFVADHFLQDEGRIVSGEFLRSKNYFPILIPLGLDKKRLENWLDELKFDDPSKGLRNLICYNQGDICEVRKPADGRTGYDDFTFVSVISKHPEKTNDFFERLKEFVHRNNPDR